MSNQPTIASQVDAAARELSALIELLGSSPSPIADAIAAVESLGRLVDCARVRVLEPLVANPALVERLGATSAIAALASLAQISERSARARLTIAAAVSADTSITGAPLPARHPLVGEALDRGKVGLDAAALIVSALDSIAGRAAPEVLDATESLMVGLAAGVSPVGEPMVATVSVDYLAGEIRQVAAAADPDGARPREDRARRRRDFRLGTPDEDGLVPASGRLLPEIGSLLAGMFEAHRRSPRFVDSDASLMSVELTSVEPISVDDVSFGTDPRTPGQRRHDALGEILLAAAAADGAPRLDGQLVTTLVIVRGDELADPNGLDSDPIGTMAGSPFPVSRGAIERFIDAGGYRVVTTDENGAVTAISSPQRCFTPLHRLAMAARDGAGCITPGCTSPHFTLQAHHVIPDRDGGPTALDNGVLLCYWHHSIVDTGPWQYRMIGGVPHVRGPGILEWSPARRSMARAA